MNTKKITARRLKSEDVAKLSVKDEVFVHANTSALRVDCYAPAFLTQPGEKFEGGSFEARTVYGERLTFLPDDESEYGVWIADDADEEIEVLQSAGVLLNLFLFVPEGDESSLQKLYTAAREAFGKGIVQRWQEEFVLVPDVKIDLYEEKIRGRKSAETRDRRYWDIYPARAQFLEPSTGYQFVQELHTDPVDDTPTI